MKFITIIGLVAVLMNTSLFSQNLNENKNKIKKSAKLCDSLSQKVKELMSYNSILEKENNRLRQIIFYDRLDSLSSSKKDTFHGHR